MEGYKGVLPDPATIPASAARMNVDCSKCFAACCRRGMALPLTRQEANNLRQAGTELKKVPYRDAPHVGIPGVSRRYYELQTDCGYLSSDGRCAIWGQGGKKDNYNRGADARPQVCREFATGSRACVIAIYVQTKASS